MKRFLVLLYCISIVLCGFGNTKKDIKLTSPDGKLNVSIFLTDTLSYSIKFEDETILAPSMLALELSDGSMLGKKPKLTRTLNNYHTEQIVSPHYRFSSFNVEYNELECKFIDGYSIVFRAYNQGIAYRFVTRKKTDLVLKNEIAEFNFDKDYTAYLPFTTGKKDKFAMAFQACYTVTQLTKAGETLAFLPITVDYGGQLKMTILESDLESYPGMFVQAQGAGKKLKAVFAGLPTKTDEYAWRKQEYVTQRAENIAKVRGSRTFPWRIFSVTTSDTEMPVNNMVYALAAPNRIGNYDWVKGGKASWEWWNDWGISAVNFKAGINMQTYKHYIDFASENGIEFVVMDEGWYKPASGNMMQAIPELDLPGLISYAKDKNVGVILWTVFNVLDKQLDEACKYYSELGIKGFKVDFLDRNDQSAVEMVYRIAEKTAKYKLTLDLHGIYPPTGLNRTYPNIINFESVFGMEEMKWSSSDIDMPLYDVTFPFIRLAAGSVDYTPGAMRNASRKDFKDIYHNPMSQGTRCHQIAAYIVYDSPLTMLCDNPTNYRKEQESTKFICSIPLKTDETRILQGRVGEFIVSARRLGADWHVGALTNWDEREITIELNFLKKGIKYKAEIFRDGINANKQASDYLHEVKNVTCDSTLRIQLASGGGFAMKLKEDNSSKVSGIPSGLQIDPFYKKYLDANGIPIVSSENVSDEALVKARDIVVAMLSKRKDILDKLVDKKSKIIIIGSGEQVCDIPEYADICNTPDNIAYWNSRARGLGDDSPENPNASCGEENLLCIDGDRYKGENILIHEFSHLIHSIALVVIEPDFDNVLQGLMDSAKGKGLWKDTYAMENKAEYFAEAVQSFFNCNRYSEKPNGVHNNINRREKLKIYDVEMYNLLTKYFLEIDIPICNDIHI